MANGNLKEQLRAKMLQNAAAQANPEGTTESNP